MPLENIARTFRAMRPGESIADYIVSEQLFHRFGGSAPSAWSVSHEPHKLIPYVVKPKAYVNGELHIHDAPERMIEELKSICSLKNLDYEKRLKMNPSARHYIKEHTLYYREENGELIVPRGLIKHIKSLDFDLEVVTQKERVYFPEFQGELREYQKGDDEIICTYPQGIVHLPTGYGKSVVALKVASRLKQKTLIIVPTNILKDQFQKSVEQFVPGAPVDVHTVAGILRRIKDKNTSWLKQYGLVIFDECHGAPSDQAKLIWKYIPAHYRYGFSATPERANGQSTSINLLFGATILSKSIERATPNVVTVRYHESSPIEDYHKMIDRVVADDRRNALIASLVNPLKRKTIILTKRIEHYQNILRHIDPTLRIVTIESKLGKKKREALMHRLKTQHDFDVILGTYSLLGTGVDIPSLDTLVLAGDLKSHIQAKQAIGRIERLFDGKPTPIVYDIEDTGNHILSAQAKFRKKLYTTHKWKVESYYGIPNK